MALSLEIYKLTKKFPREELFILISQLLRSANSVAVNLAEGSGSSSKKDFIHYLDIAIKSLFETVSHLYIAKELGYISNQDHNRIYGDADLLSRKIRSFKASIARNS